MKALVELHVPVEKIVSWTDPVESTIDGETKTRYTRNKEEIPDSARICEVAENSFDVNPTNLLWVDCEDGIKPEEVYYDKASQTIKPINHVAPPSS
ncbi:MAG TPA: hypothetical protein DCM40_23240 [Maribacter sp.]|nr:hypothetical protein [Maribacter sp.]